MAIYAALDGGQVVSWREIDDWENYPAHKKAANDEKGDGGPVLRLRVEEGVGSQEEIIIEPTRVRVVRSTPTPPDPGPPTKAQLLDRAAAKRWEIETGGIILNDAPIPTDERTRGVLTAAYVKAQADAAYLITDWKIGPGTYTTLDAATIIAMANAVEAHVQACFSANKAVDAKINDNTYTTMAQVDGAVEWP